MGSQTPPDSQLLASGNSTSGPTAIICMGVSGAGKTTIGQLLAEDRKCEFLDADDFHPQENKDKMRRGIPLTDEDRAPWLELLRQALRERLVERKDVVLACSALKPAYRTILRAAATDFGHEQAHAVGASLGSDEAYVDSIAKEAVGSSAGEESVEGNSGDERNRTRTETSGERAVSGSSGRERRPGAAFPSVVFVYLRVSVEVLLMRLKAREKAGTHYMPASLLESQIQALSLDETEPGVVTVDAELSPDALARQIEEELGRR